jgi:Bifunctional DNA primase/polymerase, N-terminal
VSGQEKLRAALAYAASGWPVFPCRPDAKVPVIPAAHPADDPARLTCRGECGRQGHGFHDATTDPAVIRSWWARWPDANPAIATGTPGPDVLDVDVKPDGNGFAALNQLKRAGMLGGAAALIRTRSGGLHVYFTGTAQGCHALRRHHLDFKATGGYVLAPPSIVGGKPYELLDHRAGTATLNWPKVVVVLDPPRTSRPCPPRTAPPCSLPGELPAAVRRALKAPAPDRSAALHRLVGACLRAGLDEPVIHEIAAGYEPAIAKYGSRLHTEVDRSLGRIGAI